MKYAIFYEYRMEDMDSVVKAYNAMSLDREKFPDKWPKQLTPNYALLGDIPELKEVVRGFVIHEAESEEQLQHYWTFLYSTLSELGMKGGIKGWVPLVEAFKTLEEWQALHK